MEGWSNLLIFILIFAALLFISAIYALVWAAKKGQLKDFEESAKSIFTDEEPEGEILDEFPGQKEKSSKKDSSYY